MDVAVIGAGLAGICSLRQLSKQKGAVKNLVVYEHASTVGGLWAYTENTGLDEYGFRYPNNYADCQTNNSTTLVQIPDFDLPDTVPTGSFLTWDAVLSYLNDYVDHFDLRKYIHLNTVVGRVHPEVHENDAVKWTVQVRQLNKPDAVTETHYFDAVFVCNGSFGVPMTSDLSGLSDFKGNVIHSGDFRVSDTFKDHTVLVVGAGPSGLDIGQLIAGFTKRVYLSNRGPFASNDCILPENMTVIPAIKIVKPQSIVLENGAEIQADTILICNGYRYSYPFLSDACQPTIDRERLYPLYKQIIHVEFPTLFFMGTCKYNAAFMLFHLQAEFAAAVLAGNIKLPSKEVMLQDIQEDYDQRLSLGFAHNQSQSMFPATINLKAYQEGLLKLVNDPKLLTTMPEVLLQHFDKEFSASIKAPGLFRTRQYPVDTDWNEVPRIHLPF